MDGERQYWKFVQHATSKSEMMENFPPADGGWLVRWLERLPSICIRLPTLGRVQAPAAAGRHIRKCFRFESKTFRHCFEGFRCWYNVSDMFWLHASWKDVLNLFLIVLYVYVVHMQLKFEMERRLQQHINNSILSDLRKRQKIAIEILFCMS